MAHSLLTSCPVCSNTLHITKLHCSRCDTTVENRFELPKFALLSEEHLVFAEIFIKCRGSIKEVEKELGISYPTVRGKLNNLIEALGYTPSKRDEIDVEADNMDKKGIISKLEKGEINPNEAIRLLKGEAKSDGEIKVTGKVIQSTEDAIKFLKGE